MSVIDESGIATVDAMSEDLIFLIAAIATDADRKRAIDLFRRIARQIAAEAYLRGQQSVTIQHGSAQDDAALAPDHRVSLIPPIDWQG